MGEPLRDVELPEKLWAMFLTHYKPGTPVSKKENKNSESEHGEKTESNEHGEAQNESHPSSSEGGHENSSMVETRGSTPEIPKEYYPLRVRLIEKTSGVLGGTNQELSYPKGGGALDLAEFINQEKKSGTFAIQIEPADEANEDEDLNVYIVSDSKQRTLNGEHYGSGCHYYYEITSFFKKSMRGEGLMAELSGQRYVSAFAGTYYFVRSSPGRLQVARLTIQDSRFPEYQCERKP